LGKIFFSGHSYLPQLGLALSKMMEFSLGKLFLAESFLLVIVPFIVHRSLRRTLVRPLLWAAYFHYSFLILRFTQGDFFTVQAATASRPLGTVGHTFGQSIVSK